MYLIKVYVQRILCLKVPLLGEPLSIAMICGLIGMGIGALQPWRWFRKDSLAQQISQQKKQSE